MDVLAAAGDRAPRAAVATGDWAAGTVGPEPPLPSPPEAAELHS